MKTATISETKNGLSALLDRVRAGESVLILDRGVPVARLEPVQSASATDESLRQLERAGIVLIGQSAPPVELLREPPPAMRKGVSAVAALLEERETGR
jgi:prevent-host-death family protein